MKNALKVFLFLLVACSFSHLASAQIYEPEGVDMPGINGDWTNPPTNPLNQMVQRDFGSPLGSQYVKLFNVQASGGDFAGGNVEYKFTSNGWGPNEWTANGNIPVNAKTFLPRVNSGNCNTDFVNGNYYFFVYRDNGYTDTDVAIMATSAAPVSITAVDDGTLTPNITLSGAKSPEERVMVRYTIDDFATSDYVEATGSGTAYSASIPDPGPGNLVKYYAFTTTITDGPTLAGDPDMFTIEYNTNGGANYSVTLGVPVPTVTLVPQNAGPTNAASVIYDITFSTAMDGVSAGAFSVSTEGTAAGSINAGSFTGTDGDSAFTLTVDSLSGDGRIGLNLTNVAGILDSGTGTEGPNPTSGTSVTLDNTGPIAVVEAPVGATTGQSPIKMKITFDDTVTGFDPINEAGDLTLTNCSVANLADIQGGRIYTIEVTPAGDGPVSVAVAAAAVTDAASNPNGASASFDTTYQNGFADPDNSLNGNLYYVTGGGPGLYNFSPGIDPMLLLRDDGLYGDLVAGDGIYSVDFTPLGGDGSDSPNQWKAATEGFSSTIPAGFDNNFFLPDSGQTTKFIMDTTAYNDEFYPDASDEFIDAILYTDPAPMGSGDSIRVAGNFFESILAGSNWDPGNDAGLMSDDGATSGDLVIGDGIFTAEFTGMPVGGYEFKIAKNGAWTVSIGGKGFSPSGAGYIDSPDNLNFTVLDPSDTITIQFDSATGRVRIDNDNPAVSPGPPWYATSDVWGNDRDEKTILYDDGTHGDVTPGDNIHSRVFWVPNPAAPQVFRIEQNKGPSFPASADGFAFETTVVGQQILVQFDDNVRSDGFKPSTRYAWTDPASRRDQSYIQIVGDMQSALSAGSDSNWNASSPLFELYDDGTGADTTADDDIFARSFINPVGTDANYQFKFIGGNNDYSFQYGQENNGLVYGGSPPNQTTTILGGVNPTFVCDAITGRTAVNPAGAPFRAASLDEEAPAPNAVNDWALYY